MKYKYKWTAISEMEDDDGNDTGWAAEINHARHGRFMWITKQPDGYHVERCIGNVFETLVVCKSLASAKRWVSMNV